MSSIILNALFPKVEYVKGEKTDVVFEPVLFTKLSEKMLSETKVTELNHIIGWVASDWNLDLSKVSDLKIAKKIVVQSIKNN